MNRHLYLNIMYRCCGSDRRNNLRVSVSDWFTESIDARLSINVLPSLYFQMCHHAMYMNNDHHFCICFMHIMTWWRSTSVISLCVTIGLAPDATFSHHRDTDGHSNWSHITSRLCAVCVWWGKNPALQKLLFEQLASVPVFDDCKY